MPRFASKLVDFDKLFDPDVWDEGILVKPFFGRLTHGANPYYLNYQYLPYVRPILYCSCVWNIAPSMFKGCSDKLDRVINRFTKLCRHIAALPSNQRLVADVLN